VSGDACIHSSNAGCTDLSLPEHTHSLCSSLSVRPEAAQNTDGLGHEAHVPHHGHSCPHNGPCSRLSCPTSTCACTSKDSNHETLLIRLLPEFCTALQSCTLYKANHTACLKEHNLCRCTDLTQHTKQRPGDLLPNYTPRPDDKLCGVRRLSTF